ncbi:hypothetical protein DVH24_001251 [Malus domestica]|uniref:Myb/SANT-like domain-containing protein n=1 Tax=Malus domestica TaxID=3750 RepID=A0A498K0V5_MALDO|nr:hypothetical protein DVH24_001251 [Malus domestica]
MPSLNFIIFKIIKRGVEEEDWRKQSSDYELGFAQISCLCIRVMAHLSLSTKKKLHAALNVLIVYLRTRFVACATSCFDSWYRKGQQKHYWTTTKDTILIESLLELHSDQTWRVDTGFKNGYLGKIETIMEAKFPGCRLKASPHIESRIKTLKAKYFALIELLALSGFEWNE